MKGLVLAAGYATRLRPLTESWAKELLPVGGRPMVDWIVDRLTAVPALDEVHLVTNAAKAPSFEDWARERGVVVHDDGTTSNEDRLGAIGDLQFVLERIGSADDLLVIAGDNLFDFRLEDFVGFWRVQGTASAVAVRDVGSRELARQYGIVTLDPSARVVGFVEKPDAPTTTLAATATYLFHRTHLPLVGEYLAGGNSPDQPGRFVGWLRERQAVYGWVFDETWYDIGTPEQLLEADNRLRERVGLPLRERYSPT